MALGTLIQGDRVLTATGYQDFLGMFHSNLQAETLVLELNTTQSVELTHDHLIRTTTGFKFADRVAIGEALVMPMGQSATVTGITSSKSIVAAPLTRSGTIVVNGVVVSCYAKIPYHSLAHAMFLPYRLNLVSSLSLWASTLMNLHSLLPTGFQAMLGGSII